MIAKRVLDLALALPVLLLLLPLLLAIAVWVRLDSPGPALFRQTRVGRWGRPFTIYKFRTMQAAQAEGRLLTVGEDLRVTRAGRFLRRTKLDELPQLLNVVKGEMSLVGPRPEVPRYVAHYPEGCRERVLSVPPGITDLASIEFRDESALLGQSDDPERAYLQEIMPRKLRYYERYVAERSLWLDLRILFMTLAALLR